MNTNLTVSDQTAMPCRLTLSDNTHLTDELISLTYSAGCSESAAGPSLGSAAAATFTAKLAGDLPVLEGAFVTLEVQTGSDTWTSLGKFRFETPETGEGVTTVTAVDAMLWALEQGYYPSSPAPATALDVLRDICDQAGVELGDCSGLDDVTVSGSLEGCTMREMAGYMAALLGRNALFDAEGRLELRWFSQSGASVGPDSYYSGGFTRKDYDWTLSGLTCSTGSGEADTLSAGNTGSVISLSNPYMTQSTLNSLWSGLQGFAYRPGEVTLLGDLRLEPGDLVTVTDLSGSSYTLAVMAVEHSYDGGWKTKITAYGSAESDTGASYKGPATVAMERYAAEMASFKKLFADEAYLQELFVRGGIVANDISAVEISASKYLTGVTIVGDVIQAGTLSAEKLILKGADGLIYELNAQAGNLTATQLTEEEYQQRLDGSVLVAHSITADKINVTDLFAQDITATGRITGVTLEGLKGRIGGWSIGALALSAETDYGSIELYPLVARETVNDGFGNMVTPQETIVCIRGIPALNSGGTQHTFFAVRQDGTVEVFGLNVEDYAGFARGVTVGESISAAGNITAGGGLSSTGNITSGRYFSFDGSYDSRNFTMYCQWADGANHNLLECNADGLTMSMGWGGSSSYATVLNLRGRTVKLVDSSGTSTLSDERMKKDWKELEGYDAFFDALHPRAFRYIDGSSGRYHLGFGAQSVEQALTESGLSSADFGGLVHYALSEEEENSQGLTEEYSLIYTEFVALLTDQVQRLKERVGELETRLAVLEERLGQ